MRQAETACCASSPWQEHPCSACVCACTRAAAFSPRPQRASAAPRTCPPAAFRSGPLPSTGRRSGSASCASQPWCARRTPNTKTMVPRLASDDCLLLPTPCLAGLGANIPNDCNKAQCQHAAGARCVRNCPSRQARPSPLVAALHLMTRPLASPQYKRTPPSLRPVPSAREFTPHLHILSRTAQPVQSVEARRAVLRTCHFAPSRRSSSAVLALQRSVRCNQSCDVVVLAPCSPHTKQLLSSVLPLSKATGCACKPLVAAAKAMVLPETPSFEAAKAAIPRAFPVGTSRAHPLV